MPAEYQLILIYLLSQRVRLVILMRGDPVDGAMSIPLRSVWVGAPKIDVVKLA